MLIANSRMLYETLRWGGVVYLLWLSYEGWYGEEEALPGTAKVEAPDSKYFLRGLVTNLLNPKAGIFYIAVLPTFVTENTSGNWTSYCVISHLRHDCHAGPFGSRAPC